jgi:hypothetical protein
VLDNPSVAVAAKNATKIGEKRILFGLVDTSTHHALSKAGPTKQQKLRQIKLGQTEKNWQTVKFYRIDWYQ